MLLKEFKVLLHLISRVPVGLSWDVQDGDAGRSLRLLPIWGFVLGLFATALGILFGLVGPLLAAAMTLFSSLFLNGGLHVRNLMLIAGAQVGEPERDARWQSIQNERIRYGGILFGMATVMIKFACYFQAFSDQTALWLLPAAFVFGSWTMAWAVFAYPTVPESKRGTVLKKYFSRNSFICASGITVILLAAFRDWFLLSTALIALLLIVLICHRNMKSLGGFSWECQNAAWEWGELAFLLSYYLLRLGQQYVLRLFI